MRVVVRQGFYCTVNLLLETIVPLLDVVVRERENNIFSREQ